MRISFKPHIHDCDKHLVSKYWNDEMGVIEELTKCSICGDIKTHWEYGLTTIKDWVDTRYKEK